MPITIELPEAVARRLAEQAAKDGKTVEALASELIAKAVTPARERTLAEILAPVRAEFAESGMTDEEWDAVIEQARQEVWEEQQKQAKQP